MKDIKVFLLEDSPERIEQFKKIFDQYNLGYKIANNKTDAISILGASEFDVILLDHDLEEKEYYENVNPGSGAIVASWIKKNVVDYKNKLIICHSLNPVGRNAICLTLLNCFGSPFLWEPKNFKTAMKMANSYRNSKVTESIMENINEVDNN